MEKNPWLRTLIVLGVVFLGAQLFATAWDFARQFSDIILIFIFAWLVAFLLNPAVEFLITTRQTPRFVAVSVVYLGVLAILVAIGLLVIPPTASQVSTLGGKFPQYATHATKLSEGIQAWLENHRIPINTDGLAVGQNLSAQAQAFGTALAAQAISIAQSVLIALFDAVIVLVISFYMMLDGPRITRALVQVTPRRYRDDVELLFASIDRSFGGYLRASFVLVLTYSVGTAAAMFLLGIPFVLPVSAFAGVMLVLPFVGDIVAVIPPLLIGLVTVSPVRVVVLLIVMVALQQVVLQVLRPKVMGKSVGLHPLWVLASFLVGARVAGIWGALFSVPVAAIVQTIVQLYYYRAAGNPDREGALSRSLRGTRMEEAVAPASAADDGETDRPMASEPVAPGVQNH